MNHAFEAAQATLPTLVLLGRPLATAATDNSDTDTSSLRLIRPRLTPRRFILDVDGDPGDHAMWLRVMSFLSTF